MKTALEQLEIWIEQFYKINGTPTLDDIRGQIILLKDYEKVQLAIPRVSKSFCNNCKSGLVNYPEINRRTCRCGALGYNVC